MSACTACGGRGTVILAFGLKAMEKPCPECHCRRYEQPSQDTDDYFADPTGTLAERLAMIDLGEALHGDEGAA